MPLTKGMSWKKSGSGGISSSLGRGLLEPPFKLTPRDLSNRFPDWYFMPISEMRKSP
jgi:hypothetical protein